jgi:hypothetical protein
MKAVDREQYEEQLVDAYDREVESAHGGRWIENVRAGSLILLFASLWSLPWAMRAGGLRATVVAYFVAALAWLLLLRSGNRWPLRFLLVLAFVLRLPLALSEPALSTDVFRYLWDGKILAAGIDPYREPPASPQLSLLHESWHSRINHPELRTIYPPHAEMIFAAASMAGGLIAWKLLLLACELSIVALLARVSLRAATAYATMPLAIVECIWSGHVEALAALALLASVLCFAKRRALSGALAALAVGLKLTPIAAVPAFVRAARRGRWLSAFTCVLLLPAIPFIVAGPVMPGMRDYATRWIFNAPLFTAVFAASEVSGIAPILKDGWTAVKDPLHLEPIAPWVYAHLYADWLARATCGVIALIAITIAVRRARSLAIASCDATGILLLCSPAVHPWYWITLLPLALATRRIGWIAVALLAPCSYLLYDNVPAPAVLSACYGLPLIAAVAAAIAERRTRRATAPLPV